VAIAQGVQKHSAPINLPGINLVVLYVVCALLVAYAPMITYHILTLRASQSNFIHARAICCARAYSHYMHTVTNNRYALGLQQHEAHTLECKAREQDTHHDLMRYYLWFECDHNTKVLNTPQSQYNTTENTFSVVRTIHHAQNEEDDRSVSKGDKTLACICYTIDRKVPSYIELSITIQDKNYFITSATIRDSVHQRLPGVQSYHFRNTRVGATRVALHIARQLISTSYLI
jgi:hypothetical protein